MSKMEFKNPADRDKLIRVLQALSLNDELKDNKIFVGLSDEDFVKIARKTDPIQTRFECDLLPFRI